MTHLPRILTYIPILKIGSHLQTPQHSILASAVSFTWFGSLQEFGLLLSLSSEGTWKGLLCWFGMSAQERFWVNIWYWSSTLCISIDVSYSCESIKCGYILHYGSLDDIREGNNWNDCICYRGIGDPNTAVATAHFLERFHSCCPLLHKTGSSSSFACTCKVFASLCLLQLVL